MTVSWQDRAAIEELMAHYAWTLDLDDPDGTAALFIEHGVFDGVGGYYDGRTQVRAMAAKSRTGDAPHLLQHWVANLLFDGDDRSCKVRSMCFGPSMKEGTATIAFVGTYLDHCVRTTEGWRFAYRRWRPWDGKMPEPDPRQGWPSS